MALDWLSLRIMERLGKEAVRRPAADAEDERPPLSSVVGCSRMATGTCLDVEKAEDFLFRKAEPRGLIRLSQQIEKDFAFRFQNFRDAMLDGVLSQKACNRDRMPLSDAVGAIDSLVLDSGIPPAVKQKYIVGALQV